jgi:hypothetical protein
MAFTLNGTQIEGGTFNSVSGNMSQVLNYHVPRIEGRTHPGLAEDAVGPRRMSLLPIPP